MSTHTYTDVQTHTTHAIHYIHAHMHLCTVSTHMHTHMLCDTHTYTHICIHTHTCTQNTHIFAPHAHTYKTHLFLYTHAQLEIFSGIYHVWKNTEEHFWNRLCYPASWFSYNLCWRWDSLCLLPLSVIYFQQMSFHLGEGLCSLNANSDSRICLDHLK